MSSDYQKEVRVFREKGGIVRMGEALQEGISRRTLYAMLDEGVVEKLSRGLYRLASLPGLEAPDLVTVSARVPGGVVCLISALDFHGLTTQIPHAVDVALMRGAERPRVDFPPVNVYWFSGAAFESGIETHTLDGRQVRIYGPEKSIADAFKYRNKLGLDVALEALRSWKEHRRVNMEVILEQARASRVHNVMRPYLEAMT